MDIDVDLPIIGKRRLKWPVDDLYMIKWTHLVQQISEVIGFVDNRRVCVQAGGACGIWPLALSSYFDTVYTFEPHTPNFKALTHNCIDAENVIALQAAISDSSGTIGMTWHEGHEANLGAQYITPIGRIPKFTVDSLELDALDLLYLDLEGAEFLAINGAEETIKRCRPVIVYEDRDHCKRFGVSRKDIDEWFLGAGYKRVSRLSRGDDSVMVP